MADLLAKIRDLPECGALQCHLDLEFHDISWLLLIRVDSKPWFGSGMVLKMVGYFGCPNDFCCVTATNSQMFWSSFLPSRDQFLFTCVVSLLFSSREKQKWLCGEGFYESAVTQCMIYRQMVWNHAMHTEIFSCCWMIRSAMADFVLGWSKATYISRCVQKAASLRKHDATGLQKWPWPFFSVIADFWGLQRTIDLRNF